jgi:hypothetical protein
MNRLLDITAPLRFLHCYPCGPRRRAFEMIKFHSTVVNADKVGGSSRPAMAALVERLRKFGSEPELPPASSMRVGLREGFLSIVGTSNICVQPIRWMQPPSLGRSSMPSVA